MQKAYPAISSRIYATYKRSTYPEIGNPTWLLYLKQTEESAQSLATRKASQKVSGNIGHLFRNY